MSVLDELGGLISQLRERLERIPIAELIAELPGISMRSYETVDGLPPVASVYFLASQSRGLLYIGRATNLRIRWRVVRGTDLSEIMWHLTHSKLRDVVELGDVSLRWWVVPREHLSIIESLLLQIHKPPWNNHRG